LAFSDIVWEEKVNKLGKNLPASTTYEGGAGRKRQGVPKHRHKKFRRRGITQNKEYNIQNKAEV